MTIPNTLTELNELCSFFIEAEEKLKNGKATDITGIDQRVSAVCNTVASSMPDQQKEYLPLMTTLIDLLNGYEKSLVTLHQDSLEEAMEKQENAGS